MQRTRPSNAMFDPGWLFLLAGLALLGATALISAQRDVEDARWLRDRMLAAEAHRQERIGRYEEFLGAVDARQPALIESLAAAQLNQIPADRAAIPGTVRDNQADASVFPALEPPALRLPPRQVVDSTLSRWISGDSTRIWLLAGSVLMILVGLLPQSRGWGKGQSAIETHESDHGALARRQSPASVLVEPKPLAGTAVEAGQQGVTSGLSPAV